MKFIELFCCNRRRCIDHHVASVEGDGVKVAMLTGGGAYFGNEVEIEDLADAYNGEMDTEVDSGDDKSSAGYWSGRVRGHGA